MTAGEINKTIVQNGGIEPTFSYIVSGSTQSVGFYPAKPDKRTNIGKNLPK